MKYEVTLHRSESATEIVECDSPQEAITLAKCRHSPGFHADSALEIMEDGEPGKDHQRVGICENCDKWLWEGDKYVVDEDGITICIPCYDAFLRTNDTAPSPARGAAEQPKAGTTKEGK